MTAQLAGPPSCVTVAATTEANGAAWVTAQAGDVTRTVTFHVDIPTYRAAASSYSSSPVQ